MWKLFYLLFWWIFLHTFIWSCYVGFVCRKKNYFSCPLTKRFKIIRRPRLLALVFVCCQKPKLQLCMYRVSHNLWQFPENWLQISNYDRYSNFEAIFKMPRLLTSKKVQKNTFCSEKGIQITLFKAIKKSLGADFFGAQWNGCSSLIATDIVNIGSFFNFLPFFYIQKSTKTFSFLPKKYHFLNNFCTRLMPLLSKYSNFWAWKTGDI